MDDATDAEIDWAYANAAANVCASIAEGFGLPIVEAAMRGLASVVTDIPVFREIGGEGVRYFRMSDADDLATAVAALLALSAPERASLAARVSVLTWSASNGSGQDAPTSRPTRDAAPPAVDAPDTAPPLSSATTRRAQTL